MNMKRRTKIISALIVVCLMVGGAYYYFIQIALPHFHTTRKGVLYRSGQPRGVGLAWVKHYGIRTLINLRKPDSNGTSEEKAFAAENGLYFYNFSIGSSHEDIAETVARFLAIVDDKSHWPILVHCSRGKERSGVLSAIFRIEYDRWPNDRALQETYRLGLEEGHMPIPENFIKNYRARWNGDSGTSSQKASEALPEVPWQD
jgi:protein tyrosine/serine phosphatase